MKEQIRLAALAAAAAFGLAACGGQAGPAGEALSGQVAIDGSSTVYLVSEAMAEEFTIANPGVNTTVAYAGTGGGFKRFCAGETDISNASRPMRDSEAELCAQSGVEHLRFDVALDGISLVVNPANDFAQCLTVEELKKVWAPGSTASTWSDIRPEWPAEPLKLYGPGTNSGTFDYFTEAIMGKEKESRPDYTASEDDNVLVQGVEGDRYALGYFGFAYYEENQSQLKALQVDGGAGCVFPTAESIKSGQYKPLSRPLMIYVKKSALARREVRRFLEFYFEMAPTIVPQVGYVAMDVSHYQAERARLDAEAGGL
jgi:phosphate transport system substrate-binding protein